VFDYFRAKDGYVQWLDDYLDRFYKSLSISELEIDLSRDEIKSVLSKIQDLNGLHESGFKIMVTGGYSDDLGSVNSKPNVFVLNIPYSKPSESAIKNGVSLITCKYVRPFAEAKTLNYFNSLQLHKKKKEYNAVDVLFHEECLSETSRGNIFLVKNGIINTPKNNILKGITRKHILELSPSIKIEDIKSEELFDFDEIFISSSNKDIMPVTYIDGIKIGDGKVGNLTKDLMHAFEKVRFN
jgi:branched-chain amino acid aminotransferase